MLQNQRRAWLLALASVSLLFGLSQPAKAQVTVPSSVATSSVAFSCTDSEATIRARNGARVTSGTSTIYIGYQQVSSTNKNPRLVRFDSGRRVWCRTDYEVTGDDGSGYGLLWSGSTLYGVFSSTGTQGTSNQDFRRYATRGWLTSYGRGGGAKVAIIARIDPANGNISAATFLSSVLTNGNSNSLQVTGLALRSNGNLTVNARAWWSPRRVDRSRMTCTGGSPFTYALEFLPNLNSATRASATGCS